MTWFWFVTTSGVKSRRSPNPNMDGQILKEFGFELSGNGSNQAGHYEFRDRPLSLSIIHTIQCPSLSDRQNLRHDQTSQSHFENVLRVDHLVGVWMEYYHPMPRNQLLLHYQKDEVQLELLKISISYVGWIPRNFKTLIFIPKLPFLSENHKNDNYLGFSQIHPLNWGVW